MSNISSYQFDPEEHKDQLLPLLRTLDENVPDSDKDFARLLKQYPKNNRGLYSKSELISAFKHFHQALDLRTSPDDFINRVRKKPIRTMSGVTPVTILTKPFPCPGKCIFCPNDVRMPKSYLADEPGAQRASRNAFDPYLQTYNRLLAFQKNGHSVDKIEVIILGGTWSFYPEQYQLWFITRCFEAMNDFGAGIDKRDQVKAWIKYDNVESKVKASDPRKSYNVAISKHLTSQLKGKLLASQETASWEKLEQAQVKNQSSKCRNVGLVIETRPDHINQAEVMRIRKLGCTKTQIGFQSLSDAVLEANKRGHDVAATRRAMRLLRQAGFKIQAHWMANLYGSSVEMDMRDYDKIFSDPDFMPDELKIYPCSLIESAELMDYYKRGDWRPYNHQELLEVVTYAMSHTPEYCRLNRVIRDIPSTDIVDGNKITNFRQVAQNKLKQDKIKVRDIRNREIRDSSLADKSLVLKESGYQTSITYEYFLQFVTETENQIVGFLRLSLPKEDGFIEELRSTAIIREVHVYGVATKIGKRSDSRAQHLGLGKKLVARALELAESHQFEQVAVISAVGTREYYEKLGFTQGDLYHHRSVKDRDQILPAAE